MIVVDTSALLAIILGEPTGPRCFECLARAEKVAISAGTLTESLIVSARKASGGAIDELLAIIKPEVIDVTSAFARKVADSYALWGKGIHPAQLNIFDCYAYVLARQLGCPLLYIGNDFLKTDVISALPLPA